MSREDHSGQADPPAPQPTGPVKPPLTRWRKFRMVLKVVELRLRFIALLAATGLVFAYWDTLWNHYDKWTRPRAGVSAAARGFEFYCPMHPAVVQGEPSLCPICGMPLSKRAIGEKQALPTGVTSRVTLAPFRVAQAGIRTEEVAYSPLTETLTTVGYVESDERRHARIASKPRGKSRVEKLFVNFVGQSVRAGEPLAELYSPELYSATQELLTAQRFTRRAAAPKTALGRSVMDDPQDLVLMASEKLRLWGLTQAQIDRILKDGKADHRMLITAPIGGVVSEQFVVQGQYVEEGGDMFNVVDLGHVWIKAQVYADQIALVRIGQEVEATVESFPGEVFPGTVAFIDPRVDPATRTVDVRYDLANPSLRLRPGMFASVSLKTPVAETPLFRSRVAASKAPAGANSSVAEQVKCPVTNAKLGSMGDPLTVDVQGRKVWICCVGCETPLKTKPAKYLARLAPAPSGVVLTVAESAVIDTGTRKVVYVETEPGVFEGREVVLGPRSGDRYPVLEGLALGDRVASAGSFLIDAESRLNPASLSASAPPAAEPETKPRAKAPVRSALAPDDTIHRH